MAIFQDHGYYMLHDPKNPGLPFMITWCDKEPGFREFVLTRDIMEHIVGYYDDLGNKYKV
jgi:hypothetical protein